METKQEEGFGIIPVAKIDGVWKVFLIHQISRHGDSFWAFPKGHAEGEEGGLETAERELKEETGLVASSIDSHCVFTEYYAFKEGDTEIEKTVTYYLGYIEDLESTLQEKEVSEAGWFELEDAREKLTHESKRELIEELQTQLRKV